jgi:hypothetical protein
MILEILHYLAPFVFQKHETLLLTILIVVNLYWHASLVMFDMEL